MVTAILAAFLTLCLGLPGPSIAPVCAIDPTKASPALALAFQAEPNLTHLVARALVAPGRGIERQLAVGAVMVRLRLFIPPEQQAAWLAVNLPWFGRKQGQTLNHVTTLCFEKNAQEVDRSEAAELVAMARIGPVAAANSARAVRLAPLRDKVLRDMAAAGHHRR